MNRTGREPIDSSFVLALAAFPLDSARHAKGMVVKRPDNQSGNALSRR
jgi:hypothetical protein